MVGEIRHYGICFVLFFRLQMLSFGSFHTFCCHYYICGLRLLLVYSFVSFEWCQEVFVAFFFSFIWQRYLHISCDASRIKINKYTEQNITISTIVLFQSCATNLNSEISKFFILWFRFYTNTLRKSDIVVTCVTHLYATISFHFVWIWQRTHKQTNNIGMMPEKCSRQAQSYFHALFLYSAFPLYIADEAVRPILLYTILFSKEKMKENLLLFFIHFIIPADV